MPSRILRSHGMPDVALFEVFRGVVIAKLSYAASAWWALPPLTTNSG